MIRIENHRSSKQLEEAPSEAIIFQVSIQIFSLLLCSKRYPHFDNNKISNHVILDLQTVLLNNLPIRYFIMKIFFALALVTCSVVLGVDGCK